MYWSFPLQTFSDLCLRFFGTMFVDVHILTFVINVDVICRQKYRLYSLRYHEELFIVLNFRDSFPLCQCTYLRFLYRMQQYMTFTHSFCDPVIRNQSFEIVLITQVIRTRVKKQYLCKYRMGKGLTPSVSTFFLVICNFFILNKSPHNF